MDKNKTGRNPSPDRDDMILKTQLNASFDKDNLTVSEDLIQRTLLKIKEAEAVTKADDITAKEKAANSQEEGRSKKSVIKFPVRRFAGAAAAILLLVSAAWIYQNNIPGTKPESGSGGQVEGQYDAAGVESAEKSALSAVKGEVKQDLDNAKVADNTMDAPLESSALEGSIATGEATDEATPADTESRMMTLSAPEVLSELYPINTEEVITFKVLNVKKAQKDSAEKSLQKPAVKAAEFYELLAAYTVQVSEAGTTGDILYSYEITTKDKNTITYEFYQEVVKVTDERLPGKVAIYIINEQMDLLTKLAEFTTE